MAHLRSKAQTPSDIVTVAVFMLLAGCLPHSCQRSESTALVPSDSLSRRIAESVPEDTLRLLWTSAGAESHALEYPRTVLFGAGDTIYAGDVAHRSLFVFAGRTLAREIPLSAVEAPFLAGLAGDTVSVFSPASLAVYRIVDGELVDSTAIDDPGREESSLVYAAAGDRIYYKRLGPGRQGVVVSFTSRGEPIDSTRLEGPQWRHAGLLKLWGDTLVSLSGYRPVVDLIVPAVDRDPTGRSAAERSAAEQSAAGPSAAERSAAERSLAGGSHAGQSLAGGSHAPRSHPERPRPRADTLALVGFDSPMLARSRSFMRGDVHEPPLLSASAAPAGNLLFVLNMRAGWLQVDVFGRDGRLLRRLLPPERVYRNAFLPQDLDVRVTPEGYEIAVVISRPEPVLQVFRWEPAQ